MKNTQVTLSEAQGPLNQLNVNLSGENGRVWLEELKKFLRQEQSWIISPRWRNNIWSKATVGVEKSVGECVNVLQRRCIEISYSDTVPLDLVAIENQIRFNDTREEVYFVTVSPRELGLTQQWTLREFLDAAPKHELELCLPGDILEIIVNGKFPLERGVDGLLDIAMEPVIIRTHPATFCIARYETIHLGYHNGDLKKLRNVVNLDRKYIFRARKKYLPK